MILHESWISHSIIGGGSADTTIAFLKQNGQNEARVDARLASDLLDTSTDVCRFLISNGATFCVNGAVFQDNPGR